MIINGIGFTGTRNEPNEIQQQNLFKFLDRLARRAVVQLDRTSIVANSGDCRGSDAVFHKFAVECGFYTVGHVPESAELRAYCQYDRENSPLGYFARNRTIVEASDLLLSTPWTNEEMETGGTWYTIKYARKRKLPIIIFWPDGRVTKENF